MRPLKFRVWHPTTAKLYYQWNTELTFFGFESSEGGNSLFSLPHSDSLYPIKTGRVLSRDPDQVWEQFTGLTDSNGQPIYEGDIVRNEVMPPRLVQFGPFEDSDGYEVVGWHLGLREALDTNPNVYVVGNVHEDAALLEGPK